MKTFKDYNFEIIKDHPIGIDIITWKELEKKMGKREYKKFREWMFGQTCVKEGVYVRDIENYFRKDNDPKKFFD